MATPLTAARMLAALKAEGCNVVETRGWSTRGRDVPDKGTQADIETAAYMAQMLTTYPVIVP